MNQKLIHGLLLFIVPLIGLVSYVLLRYVADGPPGDSPAESIGVVYGVYTILVSVYLWRHND